MRPLHLLGSSLPVALALALVACSGSNTPTAPNIPVGSLEHEAEDLVNEERQSSGISSVDTRMALREVARRYSEDMRDRGFFGHTDPEGNAVAQRLDAAGIPYKTAGETVARVTGSSDPLSLAHAELMNSATHRDVLLGPGFVQIGVGVAREGDTFWFTHILIRP